MLPIGLYFGNFAIGREYPWNFWFSWSEHFKIGIAHRIISPGPQEAWKRKVAFYPSSVSQDSISSSMKNKAELLHGLMLEFCTLMASHHGLEASQIYVATPFLEWRSHFLHTSSDFSTKPQLKFLDPAEPRIDYCLDASPNDLSYRWSLI